MTASQVWLALTLYVLYILGPATALRIALIAALTWASIFALILAWRGALLFLGLG